MAPANYHERQNRAPGKMLLHGKQLPDDAGPELTKRDITLNILTPR
jgi:hypothetical protein